MTRRWQLVLVVATSLAALLGLAIGAGKFVVAQTTFASTVQSTEDSRALPDGTEPDAVDDSQRADDGEAAEAPDDVAALAARTALPGRQAALTAALAAFAATDQAEFALAVVDHRSGLSYSFNADEAFPTASVVQVDILAALLLRAQDDGRGLTGTEQNLADIMIRESDNDAASTLWWMIGGADGLAASDARLGLTETTPGGGGYWGLTTTTVADRVRLLDTITDPQGPLAPSREYLLDLMSRVVAGQAWGVSAGAGPEESVALKNGWVDDDTGLWIINTTGRITGPDVDLTVAVLSDHQPGYAAGVAAVEQVVGLVRSTMT